MAMNIPELDAGGLRRFAFTTAGLVAGLFGLALPWAVGSAWPLWPWLLAAALALWGLFLPASLGPLYRSWMRAALVLGRVNAVLLLSAVFLAVITPMGIVMRWAGYDPLQRKFLAHARSYRTTVIARSPRHMERPY